MSHRKEDELHRLTHASSKWENKVSTGGNARGSHVNPWKERIDEGKNGYSRATDRSNIDTAPHELLQKGNQLVIKSSGWGSGTSGYDFVDMSPSEFAVPNWGCNLRSSSRDRYHERLQKGSSYTIDPYHESPSRYSRKIHSRPHSRSHSNSWDRFDRGHYDILHRSDRIGHGSYGIRYERSRTSRRRGHDSRSRDRHSARHRRSYSKNRDRQVGKPCDPPHSSTRSIFPRPDRMPPPISHESCPFENQYKDERRFRTPSHSSRYHSNSTRTGRDAYSYESLVRSWGGMEPSVPRALLERRYVVRGYDIDLYNRLKADARRN